MTGLVREGGRVAMGKPVLILGAGSWGSALALALARNERRGYLWI